MLVWFLGMIGWIAGSLLIGEMIFLIGLIIMPIFTFLLIYFDLAPRNMIFSFVKEGTGIIVMRGGEFDKIIISWRGYAIDPNTWDIIESPESKIKLFGGLKFFGIPPIQKIGHYKQRWSHLIEDGTVKKHDEELYYVLLKTDFYVFELPITEKDSAEDINGIPIDVKLVIPIRIINPYEAIFRPQRWLAAISGTIKPVLKRFVAKFRYKEDLLDMRAGTGIEDIQKLKGIIKKLENGEIVSENNVGDDLKDRFWQELKEVFPEGQVQKEGEEKEYLRIYGTLLQKKGTDIFKIDTSSDYKKMVTAEYEARQKAKMTIIEGEAQGKATENRIINPVDKISKKLAGVSEKKKLTKEEKEKVFVNIPQAFSIFLEDESINSVKKTDKLIITEGKGIGKVVGRDTTREAVREKISEMRKEQIEKDKGE